MKFSVMITSGTYIFSYNFISKTEVKSCVLDGWINNIAQTIQTLLLWKNKKLMHLWNVITTIL